ncbi:hypothetical protein [Mycoplasmopsis gallinacea]|uniref:Uncharacterized protein n=1 Tax=Mycoplasmopsis gallinacea TaxID=29556 RepID=A0A449A302_9BACT|nr:hypothetical protein [Mycoplasmopsis gallinacea]VEU58573.1 Uncharacterised protein [Mycoplasmopsis gallinacea]
MNNFANPAQAIFFLASNLKRKMTGTLIFHFVILPILVGASFAILLIGAGPDFFEKIGKNKDYTTRELVCALIGYGLLIVTGITNFVMWISAMVKISSTCNQVRNIAQMTGNFQLDILGSAKILVLFSLLFWPLYIVGLFIARSKASQLMMVTGMQQGGYNSF